MKNIKVSNITYLFILLSFLCGYFNNIVIIFIILLIHDLGHIFFIKLFNYKIININIYPFGSYININKLINTSIYKDIIISIGGILFQLILFIFINDPIVIYYNKIIILFNLIPIIPLDGSKILNLILEKYISYKYSYIITIIISFIFLLLLCIFYLDNLFIIIFLIYNIYLSIINMKYLFNKFLLERYLYDIKHNNIINNTKSLNNLRKEKYHYFNINNKYISEKEMLYNRFSK